MAPYNPPFGKHYTQLDVSNYDEDFMFGMIGKEGHNFYRLTDILKIDYLWYDNTRKVVELWGPFWALNRGAVNKLAGILEKRDQSRFKDPQDICQNNGECTTSS
jgi:hypothetical protein